MSGSYAVFHKQLGDLILLEPALAKVREMHGDPVRLITRTGHADLVQLMPGVTHTSGFAMVPSRTLYCFDPLSKSAVKSLLAPVLRRILIRPEQRELNWYHSRIFSQITTPELGDQYVAKFFFENTPGPPISPFRPPRLVRPPSEWAMPTPRDYILMSPSAGWRRKSWSASGWAHVAHRLPGPIVLTSGKTDWQVAQCREIEGMVGSKVTTISGTKLRDFLWLVANARAVLTVDGAASHLAAAFGVPCLTLFGFTKMENWFLPQPRHIAMRPPPSADGSYSLKSLDLEDVASAAERLLY